VSERVAVVDLGSNSTRLLIADLAGDGSITEVDRAAVVTRLGQGVDATGRLADEAIERVYAVLADYRARIDRAGAPPAVGVLTSAARDAANGAQFTATVRERFGIAARTIPGEEEARLTYLGATSERPGAEPTAVIDIGGGSTEIVIGAGRALQFHTSTQVGVVRHSERHLHDDPPTQQQLRALRDEAAATFRAALPEQHTAQQAIAVAGTATQSAALLESSALERHALEALLAQLAAVPLEQRRAIPGLNPARAPTIVAGVAILLEALSALGLEAAEASDHDILRGAALEHTVFLGHPPQFSG
jgi:exopolyphosphatase/guanosine-5'-triphosphate,3'-diphosphate pyrophosphatase